MRTRYRSALEGEAPLKVGTVLGALLAAAIVAAVLPAASKWLQENFPIVQTPTPRVCR